MGVKLLLPHFVPIQMMLEVQSVLAVNTGHPIPALAEMDYMEVMFLDGVLQEHLRAKAKGLSRGR